MIFHSLQQGLASSALKICLPLFLIIFVLRSAARSSNWRDETSLFISGLLVCPTNAKVWYNIAKKKLDMEEAEVALTCYREAVRLAPAYEQALNNLGNLEKAQGRNEQAIKLLRRATKVEFSFSIDEDEISFQVNPKFSAAHMNLGIVLQAAGQVRGCLKYYDLMMMATQGQKLLRTCNLDERS